ncbi:MAG: cell division protein FtsA [Clostridiales bacterium]|jgi:cell division protein FtsA|nr:cell division protein FtsA [Clostridiales bacterium]
MSEKQLIFGLDIGTRSVTGIVGYKEGNSFNVVAHDFVLHDTRAMIDGQIHDIEKVAEVTIKVKENLEKIIGKQLKEVCIAAAGRVLVTTSVIVEHSFSSNVEISPDHVSSLEILGVEKAHNEIIDEAYKDIKLHCVGYSVVKYYLNDYEISNLVGQKAHKISANVLATFLPQEVVDSLCSVVEKANLQLAGLTLEPIAAINVAIPEQYRLLNIGLVDIGAGTSDISLTKAGSVVAYGMLPIAGDEITESIMDKYLLEFKTAEQIKLKIDKYRDKIISFKDIMGTSYKITGAEILENIKPTIEMLANNISDKIIELNGGKAPNAVFIVGGGGQIPFFTNILATKLGLPEDRVALRGQEVLKFVNGPKTLKKDPMLVTPIGICLSYYNKNANFIYVTLNGDDVKLYDNGNLTVIDVAAIINFTNNSLFAKRGPDLNYTLNGELITVRGKLGEPAKIMINGEPASINSPVKNKDKITLIESTIGEQVELMIKDTRHYKGNIEIDVNGNKINLPQIIVVNGKLELDSYRISENDIIQILETYTYKEIMDMLEIPTKSRAFVNNNELLMDTVISSGDRIHWEVETLNVNVNLTQIIQESYKETDGEPATKTDSDTTIVPDREPAIVTNIKTVPETAIVSTTESLKEAAKENNLAKSDFTKDVNVTFNFMVTVNGQVITMSEKREYIFVDIFDYIEFDRTRVRGNLICKINSNKANYTDVLKFGDNIEVYWEDNNING